MNNQETVPPAQPKKKRNWLKRSVYLLLLIGLLLLAWIAADYFRSNGLEVFQTPEGILVNGQVEAHEEVNREMSLQGRLLVIEGDLSDVTITGQKTGLASFRFTKDAWGRTDAEARQNLRDVEIAEDGDSTMYRFIISPERGASVVHLTANVPFGTELNLQLNNGNIHVQSIEGAITINSVNGRIEIEGATSTVDVKTTNGSIAVSMNTLAPSSPVLLETRNGDITIALPEVASAAIEASTTVGIVTVRDLLPAEQRLYRTSVGGRFTATMGAGTNTVKATTEHGNVLLHQTVVEAPPIGTESVPVMPQDSVRSTMPAPIEMPETIPADSTTTDVTMPPDTTGTAPAAPDEG